MNSEWIHMSPRVPQSKAKKLRRQGYIPGVLYGNNHISIPVIFDKKNVENFIKHRGEDVVFEVSLNAETQPVRIKEIQRDPVSQDIIHMDLQKVQDGKISTFDAPLQ